MKYYNLLANKFYAYQRADVNSANLISVYFFVTFDNLNLILLPYKYFMKIWKHQRYIACENIFLLYNNK